MTRFGLDQDTASDVVQDAILRILQTRPNDFRNPKRKLMNSCRYRALRILRNRQRRDQAYAVLEKRMKEAELKNKGVHVALENEEKPTYYRWATPKQRDVFELLIEGLTMADVATVLGIPGSTVRMRLHLARKKLHQAKQARRHSSRHPGECSRDFGRRDRLYIKDGGRHP